MHPGRWATTTTCFGYAPADNVAPQHEVDVREMACDREGQAGALLLGVACHVPAVCRSCRCNGQNALCRRHAVTPPTITEEGHRRIQAVQSIFTDWAKTAVPEHFAGVDDDEWAMRWSEMRREQLLSGWKFGKIRPGRVRAFVKRELSSDAYGELPRRPRLIQGYATLGTQYQCAREFYSLQKAVFSRSYVHGRVRLSFASGMNPTQVGEWFENAIEQCRAPRFLEYDGKDWDGCMQWAHFPLHDAWYQRAPGLSRHAREAMNVIGHYGYGPDGFTYKLVGTTKSGHNNTTLANSLVNAAVTLSAVLATGLDAHIIVAGDDSLVVIDDPDASFDRSSYEAHILSMGVRPEGAVFDDYHDVTFVSLCFMRDVDGRLNAYPKLGRILGRVGWSVKNVPLRVRPDYLAAVGKSLLAIYGDTPVVSSLAEAFFRIAGIREPRRNVLGYIDSYRLRADPGLRRRPVPISELCDRYQLSEALINQLVTRLNLVDEASLVRDAAAAVISQFDMSGAVERAAARPANTKFGL